MVDYKRMLKKNIKPIDESSDVVLKKSMDNINKVVERVKKKTTKNMGDFEW